MKVISDVDISNSLDHRALIESLQLAFAGDEYVVPPRQHLNLPHGNIALVMPAWNEKYYGLKQIIACPENPSKGLPIIQGKYDLFNVETGQHLASIDAAKLTAVRTAAASVLASSFFVSDPKKLVILGNGVIAEHLKEAYNAFYSLQDTVIWSRSSASKIDLVKELKYADIISCATHAYDPILLGEWIKGKPHIDLVGSYKPNMREADNDLVLKCDIYVDDVPAMKESGDLAIPIEAGIIAASDIKGTLFDLCRKKPVPVSTEKPTLFKSVGHAIEDLAAAIYFYEMSI